jgi:hypothetical protein
MTRPNPIVSSALATAVVNLLAAWAIISALGPEAPSTDAQKCAMPVLSIDCHQFPPVPIGIGPRAEQFFSEQLYTVRFRVHLQIV